MAAAGHLEEAREGAAIALGPHALEQREAILARRREPELVGDPERGRALVRGGSLGAQGLLGVRRRARAAPRRDEVEEDVGGRPGPRWS